VIKGCRVDGFGLDDGLDYLVQFFAEAHGCCAQQDDVLLYLADLARLGVAANSRGDPSSDE